MEASIDIRRARRYFWGLFASIGSWAFVSDVAGVAAFRFRPYGAAVITAMALAFLVALMRLPRGSKTAWLALAAGVGFMSIGTFII